MGRDSPTIFISAAEASGDAHAARLARSLRQRLGNVRIVAVGGQAMAQAGCEMLADLTAQASMLTDPLLKLGYYWRVIRRIKRQVAACRPDLHVPVDSPALNWHLARAARKAGASVVYYIAPQVWAWAPWRVRKLARLADHVACILPFEQDWLRQRGVAATYVGHPMFDYLPARPDPPPDLLEAWSEGNWRVALLAGSRPGEIRRHSRALAEVAAAIRRRWPQAVCTFAVGDEQGARSIRAALRADDLEHAQITVGSTYEVMASSHLAVAASGTVTLELAWFGVPMVVFYRAGRLSYNLLGRWLIRSPHLSLVNILAGRRLVPELMPWHGRAARLIETVLEIMDDPGYLVDCRRKLLDLADGLRAALPSGGRAAASTVSANVADLVAAVLQGKQ